MKYYKSSQELCKLGCEILNEILRRLIENKKSENIKYDFIDIFTSERGIMIIILATWM